MAPHEPASADDHASAVSLGELPPDELLRYAHALGLELDAGASAPEMVRLIRKRQELLIELDRDAMLDIIVWARRPIRQSAGKEELAREIARVQRLDYDRLSPRGLASLARLRGVSCRESDTPDRLVDALKHQDGFWKRLSGKRRAWVGSMLTKMIEGKSESESDYRFLPEDKGAAAELNRRTLKTHVEERGIVGGIAERLRGAADDYIRVKLDEIETRIDEKLDQIDARLAEWRDREIANRLKILRITLVFTVLVAALSLGYNWLKHLWQ
ncbi:MAG TPA: hypothetical protein VJZ71_02045 [Phycisphaerae bacterium]|nr:hypothetical protein [Phycisphaerae bacterium]